MTKGMRQSFGPKEAKGWNARDGEEPRGPKKRRDLYTFAARARQQGREGLANDLAEIAETLPILEGRCKVWSHLTLSGRGSAPLDSARGGGDGVPAEVRASLAIRDIAQRCREMREDWCE